MNAESYFTPAEERRLIRLAQNGDTGARDRLLLKALPFVRKALRCRYPLIDAQDFDDLVQEAVPPLLEAIERYDLSHPARARFYVFGKRYVHKAVVRFFRHRSLLSYRNDLPDIESDDDPSAAVATAQADALTRHTLRTLSARDVDLLWSRLGGERAVTRRELAERYNCAPHVIQYAERKAVDRFLSAFPARGLKSASAIY